MATRNGERYAFLVDWTDPKAGVTWKYQLFYNTGDRTVEMFDVKNKRPFLKRCECAAIKPEHLYLGAIVTVYSRQLHIKDYGDEFTRNLLERRQQSTLAMVKPDALPHFGKILNTIHKEGFLVKRMKMCQLSHEEAEDFYPVHQGKPFFNSLVQFMSSGRIVAMELVAENAIAKWRALIGPTSTDKARVEAPKSLRAQFGTDGTRNACHGSDAPETAAQECEFFFGRTTIGRCAVLRDCSLCIVKPHAILAGLTGVIIDQLSAQFSITALEMFNLERANALEFYEVYRGVVNEYNALVDELASGPLVALEVTPKGNRLESVVEDLREVCGPVDPEIARVLRPKTLRAQFGIDKVKNAVHCTDLMEDGELESQYFFQILQG